MTVMDRCAMFVACLSCVSAALRTATVLTSPGGAAITSQVTAVCVPPSPLAFLPAHRMSSGYLRQQQPSMRMGGQDNEDGLNRFWRRDYERSAEHRRALRDSRRHSRHQSPSKVVKRKPPALMEGLDAAWVLIFNAGHHNEGVYTLQGPGESTSASVLAFECTEEAEQYAQLLLAKGFDLATPLRWGAIKLATFCNMADFRLSIVFRGDKLPPSPTENKYHHGTSGEGSNPERMYPGSGSARLDPYIAYRRRLEALFPRKPEDCGDDDCSIPLIQADTAGLQAQGPFREDAIAAIDAVLETHGDVMDLPMLMKATWEKVEADKRAKPAAEEEEEFEGGDYYEDAEVDGEGGDDGINQ